METELQARQRRKAVALKQWQNRIDAWEGQLQQEINEIKQDVRNLRHACGIYTEQEIEANRKFAQDQTDLNKMLCGWLINNLHKY